MMMVGFATIGLVLWASAFVLGDATAPDELPQVGAAANFGVVSTFEYLKHEVGPTLIGSLRGSSGDYASGLLALSGVLVLQAILVASLRLPERSRVAALA